MKNDILKKAYDQIQTFIKSDDFAVLQKDNPLVAEQYKALKVSDLTLHDSDSACPKFGHGSYNANATATGSKYLRDTEQVQTINFDYHGSGLYSASKDCSIWLTDYAAKQIGDGVYYDKLKLPCLYSFTEKDIKDIAKQRGAKLAETELKKLNFKYNGNCRLNSCDIDMSPTFLYKAYPITAKFKNKKGQSFDTMIAIYDNEDNRDKIIVDNFIIGQAIYGSTSKSAKRGLIARIIIGSIIVIGIAAFIISRFI